MDILNEALNFAKLMDAADIEWAFVGGVAVGIHGFIRATEDIDILINIDDLSKLDIILQKNGFLINKQPINFKNGFTLYRRVKIIDDAHFILDLMIPPDDFSELLQNRQTGFIDGYKVFVVTKQDLIRMKSGTGREKDKMDAKELERLK